MGNSGNRNVEAPHTTTVRSGPPKIQHPRLVFFCSYGDSIRTGQSLRETSVQGPRERRTGSLTSHLESGGHRHSPKPQTYPKRITDPPKHTLLYPHRRWRRERGPPPGKHCIPPEEPGQVRGGVHTDFCLGLFGCQRADSCPLRGRRGGRTSPTEKKLRARDSIPPNI